MSRRLPETFPIKVRLKPSPGPLRSGPSLPVPRLASFNSGGLVAKATLHNEDSNFDTQKDQFSDTSKSKSEDAEEEGYEASNAERCQGGFDAVFQQTIGVDLGDRRTGVAISWGDVGAPRSLQVLQLAPDQLITSLLDLAEIEGADEIVVGLPLSVAGTESKQALKSRSFAERLAAAAHERQVRVYLFDEALTSKDAMSYMIKTGVKRKARSATLDSMAAAVLLESYFRDKGRRAERVLWQPNGGATSQPDNRALESDEF